MSRCTEERVRTTQDPFVENSLDTIHVRADFAETARLLRVTAKGPPLHDDETGVAGRPTSCVLTTVITL